LNALRAFEAAARHLSFTRAAEELRVTQAAVSHQVKALEQRLGIALFRRLPRSLHLTDEGQALLPELRDAFDRLARAIDRLGERTERGRLTVSLLTTFALSWLVPRLPRFNQLHPAVDVCFITGLHLTDFLREDVDVAIRYGRGPWSGLRCDKLFEDAATPLCGKRWLAKLRRPEHLTRAPLLAVRGHDHWRIWLEAVRLSHMEMTVRQEFDGSRIAVDAAVAGAGVAIGNPKVFSDMIAAGQLFQPFDLVVPNGDAYWLVCPDGTADRSKNRVFRDWILAEAMLFNLSGSAARAASGQDRLQRDG
jgi:LysR family glycine cleavage system transcriptional activator